MTQRYRRNQPPANRAPQPRPAASPYRSETVIYVDASPTPDPSAPSSSSGCDTSTSDSGGSSGGGCD